MLIPLLSDILIAGVVVQVKLAEALHCFIGGEIVNFHMFIDEFLRGDNRLLSSVKLEVIVLLARLEDVCLLV